MPVKGRSERLAYQDCRGAAAIDQDPEGAVIIVRVHAALGRYPAIKGASTLFRPLRLSRPHRCR
jgi:hypothetical protein